MDEAIIDLNKRKSGPPVSVSVDFLLKKISSGVVRFLRGKNDSDFRCDAIEKVGLDFYGTSSSKLFPLLESLTFKKMKNWKEWSMPKENVESFSKLKSLTIHECERLAGDLPCILPSLKELEISYCPMIASPLPVLPNVSRVSVMQCAKIVGFKSCSNLEDLCLKNCYKLHFPLTSNYKSLQKLSVENISSSFKLLPLDSLPNIMNVRVCNCENLESFSLLNSLNSLYTLSIEECPNFTLLPDSNLDCPILTKLVIYSCDKLRFLPEKLPNLLPSLMVLVIDDCPELESIARSGLPFSLRELTIRNCNKLIASRKNWNLQILPSLGSFCIGDYECDDMESFLEQGSLPTSLTSLTIEDVAYLKTLDENGFQELKSLKELHMSRCPKLQSLPVKGLPPSFNGLLPPSFETFFMNDCPLLEANYEWEEGNDLGGKICCIPVKPQESQALEPSSLELVSTKNKWVWAGLQLRFMLSKFIELDGHPDDGFSWKQYGQKNILGAKYPRGYYSCTYRHSKGCLAKKILQRLDDDPRMVEVKYSGKHTCTNDVGHVIGRDAEQKQIRNPRIEKWLDKLQDAVEDAEDLFEEIEYDALKLKLEMESEPDKLKVSNFFSNYNTTDEIRKSDLVKILDRLDTFSNQRYILNLTGDVEKIQSQRPPSISSINDSEFVVEMVSLDFYGTGSSNSFPLLESLTFKRLPKWKKWSTPNVNVKAFPKLKSLTIHLCESLKGDLPPLLPSLTKLHIYECPKLASSLPAMPNLHKLEDLYLKNCHHLDFLPSSIYNSLQKLDIEHISGSFKLLPLNSFPNIRIVRVCDCKNLESFSLSNNLNSLFSLSIERCARLIESRNNWNLQALPNLTSFSIGDYELDPMEIFLEQGLLPTSLTSLVIRVEGLPPSRRGLLPPSFESFFMKGCPLLEAKYEWDEGNDLGWEISCISQPQNGTLEAANSNDKPSEQSETLDEKYDKGILTLTGSYRNRISSSCHIAIPICRLDYGTHLMLTVIY
ncbi:hypothetical protein G4B88_003943 [Cannabis sativa]|uniref:WRKY domain-containing protein n=1 Tax=Cannabis sativa TaxID=3483 RepID=A0A7J6GXD1_CANSA|nr:hypothetical protein G4B88_003943 [Cannabis sativa]